MKHRITLLGFRGFVLTAVLFGMVWCVSAQDTPENCKDYQKRIMKLVEKLQDASESAGKRTMYDDWMQAEIKRANKEKKNFEKLKADNGKALGEVRDEIHGIIQEIDSLLDDFSACCDRKLKDESKRPEDSNTASTSAPTPREPAEPKQDVVQDIKPVEVLVGYQYQRAPLEDAKNLNGVNAQVFFDFAQHIGIGADFAWTAGSDRIGTTTSVKLNRTTLLFGPKIKSKVFFFGPIERRREVALSFQPLFGFDHDSTRFKSSTLSTSSASTAFMMSFGGNLDVLLNRKFGIRPIDFAYQPTHFGGFWQNNWKLGAGIVMRFGREKELPTW